MQPYRDRQKPANGTRYPTLMTDRDLLYALSHGHDNTWTAFVEPVVSTGGNKSIAP